MKKFEHDIVLKVLNREELNSLEINEIIKQMNLDKTTEEWIESNKIVLKNRLYQTNEKDSKISELLNDFDNVLNPFAQNIEKIKNQEQYNEDIELNFSFVGNYKAFFIRDIKTGTIINCYTDGKNIGYGIRFSNSSKSYNVRHIIECKSEFTNDGKEYLSIVDFSKNNSNMKNDMFYIITDNTVSEKSETKVGNETKPISDIEKEKVITILSSAILLANSITTSKMINKNGKTLIRENN